MQYTFPVPEPTDEIKSLKQDDSVRLISERVQQYLNTYDEKTVTAYKSDMQTFFEYMQKNPSELHESDILGYIKYLENIGFKKSSINRKIASLSKVLEIYMKLGIIKVNPVHSLSQNSRIYKKVDKKASFNCTLKDVEEVVKKANPRTGLIIAFLTNTGLRITELIEITKNDIEPYDNRYMKIRIHGKNDKYRFIYVTYDLYVKVAEVFDSESIYLFASKSEQALSRINLYRQIKRAFIKYTGKQNITPHVLRHLYATWQIENGKDVKAVSQYLGHSTILITLETYCHSELKPEDSMIFED